MGKVTAKEICGPNKGRSEWKGRAHLILGNSRKKICFHQVRCCQRCHQAPNLVTTPFPHPSAMHSHFGLELGGWARKPLLPQDRTETSEKEATARPPQGFLSLCFSSFPPNLNACLCTSDVSSFLTADFLELISTKRFLWFKGGACF